MIELLLDFMYCGELRVQRSLLAELILAAENLKVRGLTISRSGTDNDDKNLNLKSTMNSSINQVRG